MARAFLTASNEYLSAAQSFLTARPLSVACWFYPTSTTVDGCLVSLSDSTTTHQAFFLEASGVGSDVVNWASHQTGWSIAASTATYTANAWNHAAGVETSATDRAAYLNGGNKGTNAVSRTPSGIDSFSIGVLKESSDINPFDGAIAEVGVWNVALTDGEIAMLALGISPLLIRPDALIFYAPLLDDADYELMQGLSLTPNATPTVQDHPPIHYPDSSRLFIPSAAPAGVTQSLFRSGIFNSPILSGGIN